MISLAFILPERFRERLVIAGFSQSSLARKLGISQTAIGKLATGDPSGTKHIHLIARELGTTPAYLTGETDDPDQDAIPLPSKATLSEQLGLCAVRELDLTFGMGATYLDVPVTATTRYFSHDWIRTYTHANPDALLFAHGLGDSMSPTILDSDLLLIDASQQSIRLADKIWAIAFGEVGMIKRLRPMPDGSVAILSDNPLVPETRAVDGEMSVLGRVVAAVRKI